MNNLLGTAFIVKLVVPDDIIDELNINKDIISDIYLVLTCAHNVTFLESMTDDKYRKVNEICILVGKQMEPDHKKCFSNKP